MFINFLLGKSRVFTGEEALDVLTKEFAESIKSIDRVCIKKTAIDHVVSLMDKDKEVYGIGKFESYGSSSFSWAMLIDDMKKTLVVNIDSVLSLNSYYGSYELSIAKCVDSIGEYKVINIDSVLDEINALYLAFEEKLILENEKVILEKCAELISQNDKSFLNATESIKKQYVACFYGDTTPEIPTILKREVISEQDSSNLDTIYKYVFNKEEFEKEITKKILNDILQKSSELRRAYNYFTVKDMLLKNNPDEDLAIRKKVIDAIKEGGKTLNVITMDGKKVKVNNSFLSNEYFKSSIGYKSIYLEDIKTILFGKNVLFER